ncbi:MAG: efflux RND transporter periplasmic adaptor subunit [Kiritimatiellae bacterium]|nr:efflux RND transporter periplasmic adaptor subunit [Kiritimatiellia bacterium]
MNTPPAPRSRKGAWLAWGGLLAVVALIVLFGALGKKPEEKPAPPEKAYAVRVEPVQPRTVSDEIRLPGVVEPLKEAVLGAERAGRVLALEAEKGAAVAEGQVLLRLDGRVWDAQVRRAEVESRDAERDLKRYRELEKTGAVSPSDYEAIERRRDMANITRDEAKIFLSQCEVRAPFPGVLNDRLVEVGDYAGEGQAVLRLIQTDRVKIGFDVPERDIPAVKKGDALAFTLSALPGRAFTGAITYVSGQAARESNSFRVELETANPGGEFKPGMIAEVTLVRRIRPDAIVVPLAAIVPRKGEHIVFIVEGDRAVRRRVQIDAMVGHDAVLSAGLSAGDALVIEGHRGLQDGRLVAIVGADAPATPPAAPDLSAGGSAKAEP